MTTLSIRDGTPLPLKELLPTPRAQNSLRGLIDGALAINRIAQKRLPTPQEFILQQQWLEEARKMLEDRRYSR